MSNEVLVDQFLKFWRDIAVENPNLSFDDPDFQQTIYKEYLTIGIPADERDIDLSPLFDKWVHRFENKKNIDVYVQPNWDFFCQFTNKKDYVFNCPERIKLYIPQKYSHIENSVNLIFEFLSDHDIPHMSKVGKHIRFNDIVICLTRIRDVLLLHDFIQNNHSIQEGLLRPNPFAFQYDNISYVCDGKISFHATVAGYIRIYLAEKKRTNTLAQVSRSDFYAFLGGYYNKAFIILNNVDQFIKDFGIRVNSEKELNQMLLNYFNVTELILKSSNRNFRIEQFVQHFNGCSDLEFQSRRAKTIEQTREQIKLRNRQGIQPTKRLAWLLSDENKNLLAELVEVMSKKYGQIKTMELLQDYLDHDYPKAITRDHSLRDKVIHSNLRTEFLQVLSEQEMSLEKYLRTNHLFPKITSQFSTTVPNTVTENLAIQLINKLLKMYGLKMATEYVESYLNTTQELFLAIPETLKQEISNFNFRINFSQFLRMKNWTVKDFIEDLMEKNKLDVDKATHLNRAILKTYQKYEKKHQEEKSSLSGLEFTKNALKLLLQYNRYDGFARDGKARENLLQNLSSTEALTIIKQKLRILNNPVTPNDFDILTTQYINFVIHNS